MAIKGVFTSDANIAGTRKGDFASAILQLYPTGTAPLFALSSGMNSADATDPIITWFEEVHMSGRHAITQVQNATDTSMKLDDASDIVASSVLWVEETGEYLYVLGTNGLTVSIDRGFAGTTAAAFLTTYHVQLIGNTFEEGSSRPQGVANLGYPRYNFMQIFRNAWDVTRTAKRTEYLTGDVVAKNKADCMMLHSEALERSMWFGKRTVGTRNGRPYRTMDGLLTQITSNVTIAQSTTTYDQFQTFLQPIFEKNIKGKPNERIAFCGNNVLSIVNKIAKLNATMYIEPGETEFGMNINKWITPFGNITLMTHPLFVESPYLTKNLYILHPGAIRMRYLDRTSTDAYDKDGSRAGVDGDFGVMTTEASIEYKMEKTGGQLLQMTAAA